MRRAFVLVSSIVALALTVSVRAAVEVRLKDGRVIAARRADRDGSHVIVVLESGSLKLDAADVVSIEDVASERRLPGTLNVLAEEAQPSDAPATGGGRPRAIRAGSALDTIPSLQRLVRSGDLGAAATDVRSKLVERPDDPVLRVALGEIQLGRGRFSDALEPLRSVVPEEPWLRAARDVALATALSRLDRADEARRVLELTPPAARTEATERLRESLQRDVSSTADLEHFGSTHFRVHAPPGTDRLRVRSLLDELEATWTELRDTFGAAPPEAIVTIIHPGSEFWEATGMGANVGGLYDGKVHVPSGTIDPPSPRLRAVLRHEVAHAFVDSLSAGRADRTWHEGIAEHFEGSDSRGLERRLAEAYRRAPESWPPVFDHATAHARTEWFIRRFGMHSVRDVLVQLASRGTIDAALQAVVGCDERELDRRWGRDLVAEWSR